MKMTMSKNGNKLLTIGANEFNAGRGFSIQSNGNLPTAHLFYSVGEQIPTNDAHHEMIVKEIKRYVSKFGTDRQKKKVL